MFLVVIINLNFETPIKKTSLVAGPFKFCSMDSNPIRFVFESKLRYTLPKNRDFQYSNRKILNYQKTGRPDHYIFWTSFVRYECVLMHSMYCSQ